VTPHGHRLSVVAPVPCAGRSALVESVHIVAAVVRAAQLLVHIAPAVERNALVVRKAPGVEYNEQARRSERVACSPLLKPHNMVVEQRTAAAHRLCLPRRRLRVRLCRHKGCKMRWWLSKLWCHRVMKRVELQIERILKQRKEIWEGEHEIANMEKEIEELNKQSAKIEEEMTSSGPGHYEAAIQSLNSMGEIIVS
jgi:hypothetical protein